MIYHIQMEKYGCRFTMELEASCETDARNKLDEAILLYDEPRNPMKVIDVKAKNSVLDSSHAG